MKTSINYLLLSLLTLVSLSSFTDGNETAQKLDARLYNITNTHKVKLMVDSGTDSNLKIVLKGKDRTIYYSEFYNPKGEKYSRVFNMDEMNEGVYYFEVYYKKQKLIKEVKIQQNYEKMIAIL